MKACRYFLFLGIAAGRFLLFVAPTPATVFPRVALLPEVSVPGTRVLLRDLLPPSAPQSLLTRAAEISFGAAPQPGSIRILGRDLIEHTIGADHEVASQLAVPERIVVSRNVRPVDLQEVFVAVRDALKAGGVPDADSLRLDDLVLESQVLVGPGDPGLRVIDVHADAGLRSARFKLWPSHDPEVLPFFVTARLAAGMRTTPLVTSDESFASASRSFGPAAPVPASDQKKLHEILVARGERATLILRSGTLQMFVDVVSLERGALGQPVRVRTLDGGKVVAAIVDGPAHLSGSF